LSGLQVEAIAEGDHVIENIEDRILGRVPAEDIYNPLTGNIIVSVGNVIDEESASLIGKCGIERVFIRSVVACEAARGVCAKCYGWDLSRREMVRIGEAIGIVAAQSIGEPGTQLTLRTFHIGGTTSRILEESELRIRKNTDGYAGLRDGESGIMKYVNLRLVTNRNNEMVAINSIGRPLLLRSGVACPELPSKSQPIVRFERIEWCQGSKELIVSKGGGSIILTNTRGKELITYPNIPIGAVIHVKEGDRCDLWQTIATWDPTKVPFISKIEGKVTFLNFSEKDLIKKDGELIIPPDMLNAEVVISKGKVEEQYSLQPGHHIVVKNGASLKIGQAIAYHVTPTIASSEGKIRYKDIVEGVTVRRVLDPVSNNLKSIITDYSGDKIPRICIVDRNEGIIEEYTLPAGSVLTIEDGADVLTGAILAHTEQVVDQFRQLEPGLPLGATIMLGDGEEIQYHGDAPIRTAGLKTELRTIAKWDPYFKAEIASKDGKCRFDQIIEGVTMRRQRSECGGGMAQMIIMEHREDKHPSVNIVKRGVDPEYHPLPSGAHIVVNDGDDIKAGDILAKIPRESFKSRDVTGGLPRVEELVEARRPKARDLAIITKVDGWVRLPKPEEIDEEIEKKLEKKRKRGTRIILVTDKDGEILTAHEVDVGKHVIVSDGDWVSTGDKLVDGSIDPHEYLEVMGERITQQYLLNEIQEVYRLQGVGINDKHIEIIVRQMMRKVTITDPGDTVFLQDDDIDRFSVQRENGRVMEKGGKPAQFKPKLLGITKASLGTESFISAASFQETTRVLTQAAISGKTDHLLGLKENVIMGHLIPAGSGWKYHQEYYDKLRKEEFDKVPVNDL
jgi:hypothetical protein